jgi:hypothetical protein
MTKKLLCLLAVLAAPLLAHAEIHVQAVRTLIDDGSAQVDGGSYSYYDLTLTKGEELVVDMQVRGGFDNSLSIWLLDLANFQRFEAGQQFSYFTGGSGGEIHTSTSYRFSVPSDNIYYLIMDNRAALTSRNVWINASKIVGGETEESKQIHEAYSRLYYETLKKLFFFEDFDIYIQMCGTANAFSSPDIYMCRELYDLLAEQGVPEVIGFVFLHEAAHSLLNVWDYPLYDNEDAADELATALLLLADQKSAALTAAKWWAGQGSKAEALSKIWMDDRHTVSPQRARNIINWVNNEEELTRRWLHLLIPKFTDEALEAAAADTEELDESHVLAATHELLKRKALQAQN